jgi:hypothetical protein
MAAFERSLAELDHLEEHMHLCNLSKCHTEIPNINCSACKLDARKTWLYPWRDLQSGTTESIQLNRVHLTDDQMFAAEVAVDLDILQYDGMTVLWQIYVMIDWRSRCGKVERV